MTTYYFGQRVYYVNTLGVRLDGHFVRYASNGRDAVVSFDIAKKEGRAPESHVHARFLRHVHFETDFDLQEIQ